MSINTDKLWTAEDVAEYLQIKSSVVKRWMHYEGLPYLKIGKHIRFDPEDVREWIEDQKASSGFRNGALRRID